MHHSIPPQIVNKTCANCGKTKTPDEFRMLPSGNLASKCKGCCRESRRAWYALTKVKPYKRPETKAYYKEWYEKNKERLIVKATAYNHKHTNKRSLINKENQRRARANLADRYVRRTLTQQTQLLSNDIPQQLVDAQRELLNIKRYLKEMKHEER